MKEMNKKFTIENSSCLFIEPKSMGNKLIVEPIEPRCIGFFLILTTVYWLFFTVFWGPNADTKG